MSPPADATPKTGNEPSSDASRRRRRRRYRIAATHLVVALIAAGAGFTIGHSSTGGRKLAGLNLNGNPASFWTLSVVGSPTGSPSVEMNVVVDRVSDWDYELLYDGLLEISMTAVSGCMGFGTQQATLGTWSNREDAGYTIMHTVWDLPGQAANVCSGSTYSVKARAKMPDGRASAWTAPQTARAR